MSFIKDECECSCHEPDSQTMHCFPCCTTCPHCKRERIENLRDHRERCLQYLMHYNQGEEAPKR